MLHNFLHVSNTVFHHPSPLAKSERLKQAKAEAEKELSLFKAERDEQYKKRVAEVWVSEHRGAVLILTVTCFHPQTNPPLFEQNSTSSEGNLKKLTQDAETQIQSLQSSIASKKKEVLDFLVGHVTAVRLVKG